MTLIEPQTSDPELEDDDPILSHIVGPDHSETPPFLITKQGAAKVLEAMVEGTPVTALCGYTWVPSRDPNNHPPCERCLAIARGNPE